MQQQQASDACRRGGGPRGCCWIPPRIKGRPGHLTTGRYSGTTAVQSIYGRTVVSQMPLPESNLTIVPAAALAAAAAQTAAAAPWSPAQSTMAADEQDEAQLASLYISSLVVATQDPLLVVDGTRPIKAHWKQAAADFERGAAARKKVGDHLAQSQAYVYLLRHVEMVLKNLPK
jgi:hypothetical protein